MRVITSCPSRFAIFDQARELYHRDALHRLIHGYTKSYSRARGIPDAKVETVLSVRAYGQLLWLSRLVARPSIGERRMASFHGLWARAVAARLRDDAEVFIGLSAFSYEALVRAKQLGYLTVLEHGSLHERYARRLRAEEDVVATGGHRPSQTWPPDWLIEKEDAEFAVADYVAVQSRAAAASLVAEGVPAHKIVVNSLGVDLTQFYPTSRPDDGVFRIIHCGTISVAKGIPYLLRAFTELHLPNAELWLVGTVADDVRPELSRIRSDRIYLKGMYPQSQLVNVYGRGSVFVLASLADGFGMVVPQAMACGLPVIVTENVGSADLVSHGRSGYVVPIRSVDRLKEHLLDLYENPQARAEMGQAALAAVSSGYTWAAYGDRLMNFLDSALGSQGKRVQTEIC